MSPYSKLDDRYDDHRKIKRAWRGHPRAVGLHAMAITYCTRHSTDGVVDPEWIEEKLPKLSERTAVLKALVDAGLFEPVEPDHFLVHDYLQWNESKAEREALSRAKRAAGKKSAEARAAASAGAQQSAEQDLDQVVKFPSNGLSTTPHHTTPQKHHKLREGQQ